MRHERLSFFASLSALTAYPAAAQDMVGPSWLELVLAIPALALAAAGELALFALPLLVLATIASWAHGRWRASDSGRARTRVLALFAVLCAVPAWLFWNSVGRHDAQTRFGPAHVSTSTPDRSVERLAPPVGREWPDATGYLALPQAPGRRGGGVIRVASAAVGAVYVKLCVARQPACPGLRHAYVEPGDKFSFADLPAGEYEVRYLRVDRPKTAGRSRPIAIPEYYSDAVTVGMTDALTIDSPRDPVVGMLPEAF